ncbi:permease [Veillonella sp. YH-vei2232]|uniref:Permease n=1 Tax=Veillonella absiana TaxID=3079305 RepID=A0ABU3Z8B0_9FIRM|nr:MULTISPECIES: permease [unclassified Veillonella]MDV5062884.1 permease [Veillonella sp. YH-vei2232]MDV5088163.1 permease [Veillonella sp. YH-vei2233]
MANSIPLPSVLGFLIFGPMMDVKNVWILQSFFPKEFVTRLLITTAVLSFIAAMVYDTFLYNAL